MGFGVTVMQDAQINTTKEGNGCGFAAVQVAHEIMLALKDFRVLIPCQENC